MLLWQWELALKSAAQASQMLFLAPNLLHRRRKRCCVANGAFGFKSAAQASRMQLLALLQLATLAKSVAQVSQRLAVVRDVRECWSLLRDVR